MFGRDWEPGEATIIAENVKGGPYVGQNTTREWVADVRRADGSVFRGTIPQPNIENDWENPVEGAVVSVLIDAKSGKVKFDKSDPRLKHSTEKARQTARFEAAQQGAAGSTVAPMSWGTPDALPTAPAGVNEVQVLSAADAAPLISALFSGDADGRAAAIAAFQAPATVAEPTATPEQRIAQLSELQAKGLLTAAEYQAQRQKIIDSI